MEFRVTLLLGIVLEAETFHHLIEWDGIKGLDDLQSVSDSKLHRLTLDTLKEVPLNSSDIDLLESSRFIFPFNVAHCGTSIIPKSCHPLRL